MPACNKPWGAGCSSCYLHHCSVYTSTCIAGLLGYLLFQQLIERGYSWVWVLEIIPSFALYRGLYEFSQYAFLASYGVGWRWHSRTMCITSKHVSGPSASC
jgi:hypothetical protein